MTTLLALLMLAIGCAEAPCHLDDSDPGCKRAIAYYEKTKGDTE